MRSAHRAALRLAMGLLLVLSARSAAAQDILCDPGAENCRTKLINYIRAEQVGIDVAFWFMEDARYTNELILKWKAGVPVRVLVDTRANATNLHNAARLAELKDAGIPMRERFTGGILHWKMMLFAGQGIVEFSGANYSADAWTPSAGTEPYTNYTDESIYFTGTASIVNSFRTKFDDLWMNSSAYRNYANVPATRTRNYDIYPKDPQLNFVPAESYVNRAVGRYNKETQKIDVIMYRITDQRHTNAIIAAKNRGVQVRLITEPQQYRDEKRLWHSWNVDRLYMAGVEIKHRVHAGLNHQKSIILYGLGTTVFGSSNWSSASGESQEEHNLFTVDPTIHQWFIDQFERKWNNLSGVIENGPFTPLPPDAPKTPAPANLATEVPTDTALTLKWYGGPWAHVYDVYLGTDSANLLPIAENLTLGPSESLTQMQQYVVQAGTLLPGTKYFWKVVGKTMANQAKASSVWSFTTAGVAPPPPTATIVREPYLQQVTPTGAVIVWATREGGPAQVRFAPAGGSATTIAASSTLFSTTATGMAADYYQHEARLTGLVPSTTYQYDLFVNGIDVNPLVDSFVTAPTAGSGSVTFVAFGDSGTGSAEQRQIAALLDADTFDLALHGGDLAYGASSGIGAGTHTTLDSWFFSTYRNWLRKRPVFPSMGNHDSRLENNHGRPYRDMFVLPTNGATSTYPDHAERYYSFDYGPMHIVVLDTELAFQDTSRRAAQLAWLDADLAATSRPWKIAVFHRSPYSTGGEHGSDTAVRDAFAPIFERHHVRLAISAHEHDYERSVPLTGGVPAVDGVTYLVTGGGGAPLYPSGTSSWTAHSASVHHYVRGTATQCTLTLDAVNASGTVFDSTVLRVCEPPPDTQPPSVSITAPAVNATVRGNTQVTASATDDVGVALVELLADGNVVGQDSTAPFSVSWDSTTVSNGQHSLTVRASDAAGNSSTSAAVPVTVDNPVLGDGDILLYAADASVVVGNWVRQADATASGGASMRNPDAGRAKLTRALAAPTDYFELTFTAQVNKPYRLWMRSKAQGDVYLNDSVFVQFSGASDYAIGTTAATEMNLEDCSGCRIAGWGWQDNGWGVGVLGPTITFTSPGPHTIRIQPREDGLAIDQIMLSPAKFLTNAPGTLKNDATIYPRSSGELPPPADVEAPTVSITAPAEGSSVGGAVTIEVSAADNVAVTRVELFIDGIAAGSLTASPFQFGWDTTAVANGAHTLEARAFDAAGNTSSSGTRSVTVENAPPPPDVTAPEAAIVSPAEGATVEGSVVVGATASDNVGVVRVELLVDGASAGDFSAAPHTFTWDTSALANGTHTLAARAIDAAGNAGVSTTVSVTVFNAPPPPPDEEDPAVSIASPAVDATVAGTVPVVVNASDNVAVTRVELLIDGAVIATRETGPFEFTWDSTAVANGSHTLAARAFDAAENTSLSASVTVTVANAPPPPPDTEDPTATIDSPAADTTVSGSTPVTVSAADNEGVVRVDLLVDGSVVGTLNAAPYVFTWNTTQVSNGVHQLSARAFDAAGNDAISAEVAVVVENAAAPPAQIVLYAADAAVVSGQWRLQASTTAAGGALLRHPNVGAAKRSTALANPTDFFELTFVAEAGVPYHLWIRGKADSDQWPNDSVFIQFTGTSAYGIGTTSAAEMNLEDCSGCGLAGWGWQDNGWGVNVSGPDIVFETGGLQTIRIQTREDGLSIDQIVLSPGATRTTAPGPLKNDTTILPKTPR